MHWLEQLVWFFTPDEVIKPLRTGGDLAKDLIRHGQFYMPVATTVSYRYIHFYNGRVFCYFDVESLIYSNVMQVD